MDDEINININDEDKLTINRKSFYDEMSKDLTTKRVLKDTYNCNDMFELASKTDSKYDAYSQVETETKNSLQDGSLFSKTLASNNMTATDFLIENHNLNTHLFEQVIDNQMPYIIHHLSSKYGDKYGDFDGVEIDNHIFKDFMDGYYPNGNQRLDGMIKKYFDKDFSYEWETATGIVEKSEFKKDLDEKYNLCFDVKDIVAGMKKDGSFNQEHANSWLESRAGTKKNIDPQATINDFEKYCINAVLKEKLEFKMDAKPKQTLSQKMRQQGMKM